MHLTTMFEDVLNDIRRPEYTGDNRCLPCTVVNLLVALGLAVGTGFLASPAVGVGVFLVAVVAIYVRGYLVPGTPALTKRYLPESVLRAFGKAPPRVATDGDVDVQAALADLDLLVEGADGDVMLAPEFDRAWHDRMAARSVFTPRLDDFAALLDVDVDRLDVSYHGGGACTAYLDDEWLGRWESAAAFNADVTAEAVLTDLRPAWRAYPLALRGELLAALRVCLDVCPACGGHISLGTETVESCCSAIDVVAANCDDCDTRLFEAEFDPARFDALEADD